MYEDAGTIYVYQSYGIHYLMNFVTLDKNTPEATLIRAVDPINQLDNVSLNRFGKLYSELNNYQKKNLTNGPGKLTKALKINKNLNGANLFSSEIYLEEGDSDFDIVVDKRIGIDYSKEAIDYPYRFYIKDNDNVSILKK